MKLKSVKGNDNLSDHCTKPKSKAEVEELLSKVGAEFVEYSTGARAGPPSKRGVHLWRVYALTARP